MKITMSQVLDLKSLYEKIKTQTLSISTTYKFSKLFSAISKEADFYSESLNKLIEKYAEKDEEGRPVLLEGGEGVKIQKDFIGAAQEELEELISLKVELPDIQFRIEELEKLNISVDDFHHLLPFVQE